MTPPPIAPRLLGAFLSVYPTIIVVGWAPTRLVEGWPWSLRTLVLVAVLAPVVVLVVGPPIDALLSQLERDLHRARNAPRPRPILPDFDPPHAGQWRL